MAGEPSEYIYKIYCKPSDESNGSMIYIRDINNNYFMNLSKIIYNSNIRNEASMWFSGKYNITISTSEDVGAYRIYGIEGIFVYQDDNDGYEYLYANIDAEDVRELLKISQLYEYYPMNECMLGTINDPESLGYACDRNQIQQTDPQSGGVYL